MDNRRRDYNGENRFLYTLVDLMTEYNYTVRTSERRFHDNMAMFLQIVQNDHNASNRSRRQQYAHYPQNNNAIPNQRYAFYARPFSDSIYTNIISETINTMLPNLQQDVQVNLSEEQINQTTETFPYRFGENVHTTCPISQDDFQEGENVCKINHCGHMFRENSIKDWFRQNVRCPVCRYDLRTNNDSAPIVEEPRARERISVDTMMQNLSSGIQNIIHNYLDRDTTDNSLNQSFTFEVPLYTYNDLSGVFFR
jgi:hypothetical protein